VRYLSSRYLHALALAARIAGVLSVDVKFVLPRGDKNTELPFGIGVRTRDDRAGCAAELYFRTGERSVTRLTGALRTGSGWRDRHGPAYA
jgi:hypothetical protein